MSEPTKFGRFDVEGILGRGAMGIVYLATDSFLQRKVAIKTIQAHPDLEDQDVDELRERFVAEARAASSMTHPNLVTVYDVGQEGDRFYIAMEYVRGEGLDKVLRSDRVFSFKEIADLAVQICSALDYAHAKSIVHRDIKPANIMLTRAGRPKIADFGVARHATSTLTRTGSLVGTPAYMSPEQITGHPVSGASDQFSFAVVLFQMLTGEQPFDGDNPTTLMYRIVHAEPRLPRSYDSRLPEAVDRPLARALSKDPADRYPTCAEFAEDVRAALGAAHAGAAELLGSAVDITGVPPEETPKPAESEAPTLSLHFAPTTDEAPAPVQSPPEPEPDLEDSPSLASSVTALLERLPLEPETVRSPAFLGAAGVAAILVIGLLIIGLAAAFSGGGGDPVAAVDPVSPGASPGTDGTAGTSDTEAGGNQGVTAGERPGAPGGIGVTPAEAGNTETAAPDPQTAAAASAAVDITLNTNNDPARVVVDGEPVGGTTPLVMTFEPSREYVVRIEKDGFEPVSARLSLDRLSDEQLAQGSLFFPLESMATEPVFEPVEAPAQPSAEAEVPVDLDEISPIRLPTEGQPPEPVESNEPDFPAWAAEQELATYVIVEVVIDTRGRVRDARILGSGVHPELDALALEAVLTWTFRPAQLDGEAVAVLHNTTVRFREEEGR